MVMASSHALVALPHVLGGVSDVGDLLAEELTQRAPAHGGVEDQHLAVGGCGHDAGVVAAVGVAAVAEEVVRPQVLVVQLCESRRLGLGLDVGHVQGLAHGLEPGVLGALGEDHVCVGVGGQELLVEDGGGEVRDGVVALEEVVEELLGDDLGGILLAELGLDGSAPGVVVVVGSNGGHVVGLAQSKDLEGLANCYLVLVFLVSWARYLAEN
ncbi:hypothetical protein PspLS_02505, partial [Pyricularia sp. CBS 133598]